MLKIAAPHLHAEESKSDEITQPQPKSALQELKNYSRIDKVVAVAEARSGKE